jgi:hypothetical protein
MFLTLFFVLFIFESKGAQVQIKLLRGIGSGGIEFVACKSRVDGFLDVGCVYIFDFDQLLKMFNRILEIGFMVIFEKGTSWFFSYSST